MATTKLTLSIEAETIEKAKKYAKKQHISLSKFIQNFLQSVADEERNKEIKNNDRELSPEILALTGIIKGNYTDKELDTMKYEYLKEKYDL